MSMTDREFLQSLHSQIAAFLDAGVVTGGPLVIPPPLNPIDPLPPKQPKGTPQAWPGFGNTAAKVFDFVKGAIYYWPIPINSNGSLVPAGEGVYPEGLDADMWISKIPGDYDAAKVMPASSGGFGGIVGHPYFVKVSNGLGATWRSSPAGGAAYIPAGEQWYVGFRANNIDGRCILQASGS